MRSIFIFAHPDDEFGCYASIRRESSSGNRVECYYLTDGGYRGQVIARREKESLLVLAKLGVSESDVKFLGRSCNIPDGYLPDHMIRAADALINQLGNYSDVEAIYAPVMEGGHQDHDAANVIAVMLGELIGSGSGLWQFPLYNGSGLRGVFFRVMSPIESNGPISVQRLTVKDRFFYFGLCFLYPSQWKTWLGLLPFIAIKLLFGGSYFLQKADPFVSLMRPHRGSPLYERRGMADMSHVEQCLKSFMRHYRSRSLKGST